MNTKSIWEMIRGKEATGMKVELNYSKDAYEKIEIYFGDVLLTISHNHYYDESRMEMDIDAIDIGDDGQTVFGRVT